MCLALELSVKEGSVWRISNRLAAPRVCVREEDNFAVLAIISALYFALNCSQPFRAAFLVELRHLRNGNGRFGCSTVGREGYNDRDKNDEGQAFHYDRVLPIHVH